MYETKTKNASMCKLISEANEDRTKLLTHNNDAHQKSLAVSLEDTEPVDYIPYIEILRELDEIVKHYEAHAVSSIKFFFC